jgi:hypothetical protein
MPEAGKKRGALPKLLLISCAILLLGLGLCGLGSLASVHREYPDSLSAFGALTIVVSSIGLLASAIWALALGIAKLTRKQRGPS